MGCPLVHVNNRRYDIFPANALDKEVSRPLKKGFCLLPCLSLEKFRAGRYQRIDKPGTVLACSAPGPLYPALDKMIIPPSGLTIWKLYLLLDISMSGLLAYFSFCLSWWASSGRAGLPLCFSNRKMAYCGNLSILLPADG